MNFFQSFASSLLKYKKFLFWKKNKFLKLGARKFHFPKYKTFLQSGCFFISRARKVFPWNFLMFSLGSSIFQIIRVPFSRNIRKTFFEKIEEIFSGWIFLFFFELGLKSSPGCCSTHYSMKPSQALEIIYGCTRRRKGVKAW